MDQRLFSDAVSIRGNLASNEVVLGGVMIIVLATGPKVRGFKVG